MNPESPRFAMVAGEASGDLLAGSLLASLRERWPDLVAEGIGGPRMAEQGFVAWWPHDKLSVHGYAEVLGHLREMFAIRGQLRRRACSPTSPTPSSASTRPTSTSSLERRLKAAGIKTVHFVSPSIWAWRGGRIDKIGRATDLVLCIFPFEPAIYAKRRINAVYVGHPLASAIPFEVPRAESRAALGIGADETLVALLPGSRRAEIRYIAPRLFGAAAEMSRARPGCASSSRSPPGCATRSRRCAGSTRPTRRSRCSTAAPTRRSPPATSSLVASGTATLEAALFKRPMVVVYVMHLLNWWLGKLHELPAVGRAAEHPAARLRRSRAAAGRRDAGRDRRRGVQVARRSRGRRARSRCASRASTAN